MPVQKAGAVRALRQAHSRERVTLPSRGAQGGARPPTRDLIVHVHGDGPTPSQTRNVAGPESFDGSVVPWMRCILSFVAFAFG